MSLAIIFWVVYAVLTALFLVSFIRERRLYANAVLLGFSLLVLMLALGFSSYASLSATIALMVLAILIPVALVVITVMFIVCGVMTMRREGWSLSNGLAFFFAIGLWVAFFLGLFLLGFSGFSVEGPAGTAVASFGWLLLFMDLYVIFSFVSLFIYSLFYRIVPKRSDVDYIMVLGCGLTSQGDATPLLASRLDKALDVWRQNDCGATFVTSGGQGPDEARSEAAAMADYLMGHGVPSGQILLEDASRDTYENMTFSKRIMDARGSGYRCVFVTNDFHVFRAATYAHEVGLKAEGVGCHTVLWYWTGAFVREYIAIVTKHWVLPAMVAGVWILAALISIGTY